MMGHRKIQSQGSIPFTWEEKPNVFGTLKECPLDKGVHALSLESSSPRRPASCDSNGGVISLKIPLPPCPSLRPPQRSTSAKRIGGWWQEDPFFAAYKECTKSSFYNKKSDNNGAANGGAVGSKPKKKKKKSKFIMFSCKSSCEAREDNFVRLSNLPPLPKQRTRTLR